MKKAISIIAVVIVAALVLALAGMLIGSLITSFSPKPTQYENSLWWTDDHRLRLSVYEYDPETYQCRAELSYYDEDGNTYTYTVSDAPYGVIGVYTSPDEIDEWLRVWCSSKGFTVKINRTANLEYSSAYQEGEKVSFKRLYLDPLNPDATD